MNPEHATFLAHIDLPAFQDGTDRGLWGLHTPRDQIVWPHVIFWLPADAKVMPCGKVYLRFDLQGYPLKAPTACPWDVEANGILPEARWPKGRTQVDAIFKPKWKSFALYVACDRVAMEGHPDWPEKYPSLWWQSTFTIVKYLDFIQSCLNRCQYEHPDDTPTALVATAS